MILQTQTEQRRRIIVTGKPLVYSTRNITCPYKRTKELNVDIRIAILRAQLGLPKKKLSNLIKYN